VLKWKKSRLKIYPNIPTLQLYLDGIEQNHFGGTCYSNNYYFNLLLKFLGFDTKLCGADMANPDVHMVSIVRFEGQEYIVDVGYGAPFLAPLPRNLRNDHIIKYGDDSYVLKPQDLDGFSRLQLYRNGKLKHGYHVKPQGRDIGYFSDVISASFRPEATFMNAVLLVRFFPNRTVTIHNYSKVESTPENSSFRKMANNEELIVTIERNFGIPTGIISDALGQIKTLKDAWD
jgi:arylamine N-acetyltransferase